MAILSKRDRDTIDQFRAEFQFCWACGCPDGFNALMEREYPDYPGVEYVDYPRHLELHHLIGGAGRKHDRRNLSMLCKLCHDVVGSYQVRRENGILIPSLRLDHMLWLKHRLDTEDYDRRYLWSLRPKSMPPARRPPQWFSDQRLGFGWPDW